MFKVHIRVQTWALLAGLLASVPSAKGESKLPAGPGKDAFVAVCGACHAPGRSSLTSRKAEMDGPRLWNYMVEKGASGTDQQMQDILIT